jgi:hypothetical protein
MPPFCTLCASALPHTFPTPAKYLSIPPPTWQHFWGVPGCWIERCSPGYGSGPHARNKHLLQVPGKCVGICGAFFFCDQSSMDTPTDAQAAQTREQERRERERAKHRRYYEAHRDALREKAHQRYYKLVHNTLNPPPLRANMKVAHLAPAL